MYEPYGEEKKGLNLKEKFSQLKEKIKEKLGNLNTKDSDGEKFRLNKVSVVVIALGLLLVTGTITGFVSYTGKITDLESENMVLQRQKDDVQAELNDVSSKYSSCNSDLSNLALELDDTKTQLTQVTFDYQASRADLDSCGQEKLTLSSDLNLVNDNLNKAKEEIKKKNDNINRLQDDLDDMACKYAKSSCNPAGMKYFYLDGDDKVVCCLNSDTCVEEPSGEEVKEITC